MNSENKRRIPWNIYRDDKGAESRPEQQPKRHEFQRRPAKFQTQRPAQRQAQRPAQRFAQPRQAPARDEVRKKVGRMTVTFYGAAGEVGRSCIMVESKQARIILDAGIKLGEVEERPVIEDSELRHIDAVVLSHAHMDHSSYLPHFFSKGYNGPVYATKPTFELVEIMTKDYMNISNPEGVTKEGVKKLYKHCVPVEYYKEFRVKDLRIRLLPAGHILGSAMIEVTDGRDRLLYSGDINMRSTKLFDPAYDKNLNANVLIIESTYGGKNDVFPSDKEVLGKLAASIKETVNAGGKVIVPSLGVGRAQEILFTLDDYVTSGVLPKVPIYVDGMIGKVLKIYKRNVRYCKGEIQNRVKNKNNDPFESKNFTIVTSRQQRAKVLASEGACVVVTTSGMLKGGPVIQYLEKFAGDSNNKIILTSHQAEDTPGRQLLNGERDVVFGDEKLRIKIEAKVEYIHMSGHADRPQLLKLIGKVKGLKTVFIEHGEEAKAKELYETVRHRYDARLPVLSTPYELK
jgi:hypothetical protein